MQLIDAEADLVFDGRLTAIKRTQEITDDFLTGLADARMGSRNRAPEAVRVASIPAALVESWQRQGFDVFRESAAAICSRLRAESLTAFLATERSV